MVLCDIGNSYLHFYYSGRVWKVQAERLERDEALLPMYYVSVNQKKTKYLLEMFPEAINLTPYMLLDTAYIGLGADRIAACKGVSDGVIVDAGSAITIDVMQDNMHLGGCILPGLAVYGKMYRAISPMLGSELNLAIEFNAFPQNTRDALSYGALKSIILTIESIAKNKKLYFTGGDGKFLARFFTGAIQDDSLVFKGMLRTIAEQKKGGR
ncbi:MAG: type III pantothenate kinase [Helicobacter sp.]|nr:type III pantothenate kinase [Helicobacter sp.]MBD5168086.1 type III pantothenate kinase [Helicobacter sp.]MDE5816582.1 type III pantothenate kinase [Helicobacter sp.]MDE6044344.1 type III pantothenate kinase [Helicobacter sp.]MDE7196943.1 type III pantothenate kinase [Helicobacter sp.]